MKATTRKAIRDLRRQRAQVAAVAVTILLGVALFIASAGAFRNLSGSYRHTYHRLHFADLVGSGGNPDAVAQAATKVGASATQVRTQADTPMLIAGTKLLGRLVGLPAGQPTSVDAVDVFDGAGLSASDASAVLVDKHAATTFGLHPGSTLSLFSARGWQTLTVRGVVVSAEYLWPARSRQEPVSDPHSFAVIFAPEASVRAWTGGGPNQTLVLLPGGQQDPHGPAVTAAMRAAGATDVITQREQASQATLQEDLDGFNQMSVAFPLLFLTAAAVAGYVLLARRVRSERPIIGTLMACGARRGRLVRHYLLQGALIGLAGGVVGVGLGVLATGIVTHAYTHALGIPDTLVSRHLDLDAIGLVFGVAVGLLGALAPAWTASRTVPADAMRNEVTAATPGRWSRAVSRMRFVPVTTRLALRDLARSRRRTVATALGSVLALLLVLASVGMMTSILSALHLQYGTVEKQDATVTVDPTAATAVEQQLRHLAGVAAVETSVVGAVTVSAHGHSYSTELQGFTPTTTMHGFRTPSGSASTLPADGVLAGRGLAGQLHVGPGDTLTLTSADGRRTPVLLAGFVDEPLGTLLYTTNDHIAAALPATHLQTYLVRFGSGVNREQMRHSITALPAVVAYADAHSLLTAMDKYLALFWVFVAVMVALGSVLALAIIYVTMTVNIVERTNELATLRAAGVPLRRVAATLATGNLAATGIGIPIGLACGWLAADRFLALFSNDMFHLPLNLGWGVLVAAAAAVLLAAGVSQYPAMQAVRGLDIARVVRERAT